MFIIALQLNRNKLLNFQMSVLSFQSFSDFIIRSLNTDQSHTSIFVSQYQNQLFLIDPLSNTIEFEIDNLELITLFDKSGLCDVEIEFSPTYNLTQNQNSFLINNESISKKVGTFIDFNGWLEKLFKAFGGYVVLIPDTNIIKRKYFSNFIKKINTEYRIIIPRLVILEIEYQYNRNKKDNKKENSNSEINRKNIRDAYSDMVEVLNIKKNHDDILPLTDKFLIDSFSRASGNDFPDAWIRMEIEKYHINLLNQGHKNHILIYLTSDLMNSLSSIAENLNVLYFYRREKVNYDVNKIPLLLYNTAVHFEKCHFNIGNKNYEITGTWQGKSSEDWRDSKVRFKEISRN